MIPALSVELPSLWQTSVHGRGSSVMLSTMWSLVVLSLVSAVVHGGEYMTVSRSSAIVNISYYNPVTDSVYTEVRRFADLCHVVCTSSFAARKLKVLASPYISCCYAGLPYFIQSVYTHGWPCAHAMFWSVRVIRVRCRVLAVCVGCDCYTYNNNNNKLLRL